MWKFYQIAPMCICVMFGTLMVRSCADDTFNIEGLFLFSLVPGVIAGLMLAPTVVKSDRYSNYVPEGIKGYKGMVVITCVSIFLGLAMLLNSAVTLGNSEELVTTILKKEAATDSRWGKWGMSFQNDEYGHINLKVRRVFWEKVSVGDNVYLEVEKGIFGYWKVIKYETSS